MGYKKILSDKRSFNKFAYLLIAGFLVFLFLKSLSSSLFFHHKDRVNFLVYGPETRYYTLSQTGSVHYVITFDPDVRVIAPGGYSFYRFGALGWLVNQEKKPEIFKKAVSSATATFNDFYFYPGGSDIFYADKKTRNAVVPSLFKLLFYKSNANFFDRIYLATQFLSNGAESLNQINFAGTSDDFVKKYQGHFFQKSYRDDNKSVQIIYTKSYNSAANIGSILEGNGIRVVDLATSKEESKNKCRVYEEADTFSQTAQDIADFFGCTLLHKNTQTFDIIIELGRTEGEWDVD